MDQITKDAQTNTFIKSLKCVTAKVTNIADCHGANCFSRSYILSGANSYHDDDVRHVFRNTDGSTTHGAGASVLLNAVQI